MAEADRAAHTQDHFLAPQGELVLAPDLVKRAASSLARYLGPIARVVVKNAAARNPGKKSFYARLAESIANPDDRARFLREAGFT